VAKRSLTHILREGEDIGLASIFGFVNIDHIHTEGKETGQSVQGATKMNMMAYNLKQDKHDQMLFLYHKGLHTF
jgi:hypothetical protein